MPRTLAARGAAVLLLTTSAKLLACSRDTEVDALPPSALSDRPIALTPRFSGPRFAGCVYASPLAFEEREGGRRIAIVDGGGSFTAIDAKTGERAWELALPAPEGERAFAVATPVLVGRRAVVAFHTIPSSAAELHVTVARLRHRVAVIDLDARALDPDHPPVDLAARVPGRFGAVTFSPGHAMARGALVHVQGRVYVTLGNPRDVQPYRGWVFELDLEAWRTGGAGAAISAAMPTTEDVECGDEGGDGTADTRCGAGVWTPSGPLVLDADGDYRLVVATGNGQLDLARGDYANSLLRVGAGLAFDPGCDAARCSAFSSETLDASCVESCRDAFVPRLLAGERMPAPASGTCEGKSLYLCWASQDQLDGGSTPALVTLRSGRRVLVYPTKDGHLWLVDAAHMGRVYAHVPITEPCGTAEDACVWEWSGTIVTKPEVTEIGGEPAVLVPTFMPDGSHAAGVVALQILEDERGPRLEPVWRMPPSDHPTARRRFRRHPSRVVVAGDLAFVVDAAPPRGRGTLYAMRKDDGRVAAEVRMSGPGYRFAQPLPYDGAVFVTSCDGDFGPGSLEAFDVGR